MDENKRKEFIKEHYEFEDLRKVVWQLRAPDGCPWDREQTHESMHDCMIEEAFEVVEAVNNKDIPNLREELGDVMLQVLLHSAIAEENQEFTFEEVVDELAKKLVRRHPHVFGEMGQAKSAKEGLSRWDAIKMQEKEMQARQAELAGNKLKSELWRIPEELPPVMRAYKVIKKSEKLYGHAMGKEELLLEVEKFKEAQNNLTKAIETFIKDKEGVQ